MSLQAKLRWLLGLLAFVCAILAIVWNALDTARIERLLSETTAQKAAMFRGLVDLESRRFEAFVNVYSYWDDMVTFTRQPSARWADENLDPEKVAEGTGLSIHGLWVHRADHSLIHARVRNGWSEVLPPLTREELADLTASSPFFRFFTLQQGRLIEWRGTPIQPSADFKRRSTPTGYFIAARCWDDPMISAMEKMTGSDIRIVDGAVPSKNVSINVSRGTAVFATSLPSWKQRGQVHLRAAHEWEALPVFQKRNLVFLAIGLGISSLVFLFLGRLIYTWFGLPHLEITASLQTNSIEPIRDLMREPHELGRIANQIATSFRQRDEILREITERKKTEAQLLSSEKKYRALLDQASEAIFIADAETGHIVEANQKAAALLGLPVEKIIGLHQTELHPLDQREALRQVFARDVASGGNPSLVSFVLNTQGEHIPVEISATVVETDGHRYMQGIFRDLRERRKMERLLIEEREQLRLIMDSAPSAVFICEPDGRILRANRSFAEFFGRTEDGLTGQSLTGLLEPEAAPAFERFVHSWKQEQLPDAVHEFTAVSKNPPTRELVFRFKAVPDESGNLRFLVAAVEDRTRQRLIEDERIKASKLESLGVLAGGIAHDLNNIMLVSNINLDLALSELPPDAAAAKNIRDAREACLRASALSKRLVTFAKGGNPVLAPVNIRDLLTSSVDFALRGSNLKPEFHIDPDLLPVMADAGQISQVIDNIVINAREATPLGGRFTVSARNVVITPGEIPHLDAGPHIRIDMTDPGIGMPAHIIKKIFDPYFTTKQSGSGIGLATCYAIVTKHRGAILADSRPGTGTTLTIYLPALTSHAPQHDNLVSAPISGSGRVLVVDDEARILEALSYSLRKLGYEPDTVENGEKAFDLIQAAGAGTYAAILLDGIIPGGLGGEAALARIRTLDSSVPVILCTGYLADDSPESWKKKGFQGRLQKPFTLQTLSSTLHSVLQRTGGSQP
jgi:PAS domain S-box-containing protein